jgi:tetratricopeptide (TPR) repeat protein
MTRASRAMLLSVVLLLLSSALQARTSGRASALQDASQQPDAAAAQNDPLASTLSEIRGLLDRGQASTAIARLEALNSPDPRVRELLGVAYYRHDDYVRAIQTLSPLIGSFAPDSVERREAVQVLGLSYYLAGRLPDAIPLLEQTGQWATSNAELWQVLGMAYIQTHQPDKARVALARAFGVDPQSPGARLLAAQMMVRIEFFEMADEELRKALELDARLPHANFLLGTNAVFRNRLDDAVAYFEKELAINPANAMALYRLGEAFSRRNDWDHAIPPLQRSLWINPFFSGPYVVLGRAYLAKQQVDTAEGMLRRAVEYDPNNKSARYLLGQVLQRLGKEAEAKEQFAIAEKLPDK